MKAKLLALASLIMVAACAASEADPAGDSPETEDELNLAKGNIDHAAIVESGTMMLAGGPLDGKLDSYNEEDPFAIRRASFEGTFAQRLAQFDAIDGKSDWQPDQINAWVSRMSTGNYQVIDTSKPCDWANPHTYLEIERATMTGREHTTCGGRMPNEDAMDVNMNFLVRGPAASVQGEGAISDGVDHATKPSTDTFPYLAELNGL
jgi:hypothetical protein